MTKVFYWCPYLSNVATINNVINSAISLAKYDKKYQIFLLETIGEWQFAETKLMTNNVQIEKLTKTIFKSHKVGFIKSRIYSIYLFIINFYPLIRILKSKQPNFIIIHLLTSLPLLILYFFKLKTKFILRISGLPRLNFFRKCLWKLISKKIYLVTCPSKETLIDIQKMNIFDKKKLVLLEDPIINISEIQKQKKKIDKKDHHKDFYLNIGRLTTQKNQKLLIEFFRNQLKESKNLLLYIIGEGEKRKELKKLISKYQLEKNIFLLGYKKNIYSYLLRSKAIILSSLWEDPGAVMIEAAFCNIPIISSDCKNGPKEFLMNSDAGYLFENNNINSLKTQFIRFNNEDNANIAQKILLAKINSKNYTLFNHFKKLDYFLQN